MGRRGRKSEDVSRILDALASPVRVEILKLLERSPMRYNDIARSVGATPAGLAYHMKKLEQERLIEHNGDVYEITPLGKSALSIIGNIEIAAASDVSVLVRQGYALPLRHYVESFLGSRGVVASGSCSQQKILRTLIEELEAAGYASGFIPQSVVDASLYWILARNRCMGEAARSLSPTGREGGAYSQSLEVLAESGLLEIVASNLLLLNVNWASGVASLYLPSPSLSTLKLVLKRRELFPEVVVDFASSVNSDAEKVIDILLVSDSVLPVTYLVDASGDEKLLHGLLERMAGDLPLANSLLVVYNWEKIGDDALQMVAKLVNNGVPVVFTSGSVFPSQLLYAFTRSESPILHLGTATFPMPFVLSKAYRSTDFLIETERQLEKIVQHLRRQSAGAARVLESGGHQHVEHLFHVSLAGFEGGLLRQVPVPRELLSEPDRYKRIITERIMREYYSVSEHKMLADTSVVSTLYTPSSFLTMLVALYLNPLHLHVNPLGPLSLNRDLRTKQELLELEAGIQGLLGSKASILEIRVSKIATMQLKELLTALHSKGIQQFTITILGLHVCNVCGNVLQVKVSRCPKCYSPDISGLARPGLRYLRRDELDAWTLEELDQRLIFSS